VCQPDSLLPCVALLLQKLLVDLPALCAAGFWLGRALSKPVIEPNPLRRARRRRKYENIDLLAFGQIGIKDFYPSPWQHSRPNAHKRSHRMREYTPFVLHLGMVYFFW